MKRSESSQPEPEGKRPVPTRVHVPGYVIEGVIGRGATGVVYRARQEAVDREVALKVLRPELTSNPRVISRLKREARTTARLAHPNVISAIDMGEVGGRWWYAMELVEGGTLEQLIKRKGALDERRALRLFIPLVEALVHLAEHGVVHRDIKPANILIDERTGIARLADLGLAFADDDPERTQAATGTLGTPAFMSPEQAVDSSAADSQSDLWSMGATMFHALTGRPPFRGASAAEVLSEVLHARIEDPQSIEPELSSGVSLVIRKCLVRERGQRYQRPKDLLTDLERVRERRAPRVRRRELQRTRRELTQLRVAGGLAIAALLAAGIWGFLRSRSTPAGVPGTGEEVAASPALDFLVRRAASPEPGPPGLLLRELEVVSEGLTRPQLVQANELASRLRSRLRQDTRRVASDVAKRVRALVDGSRFVEARAELEGFEAKLVSSVGATRSELEAHRVLFPTLERESVLLEDRLEFELRELGHKAEDHVSDLRNRARSDFQRGNRREAFDALAIQRKDLLEALGASELDVSEQALDDTLVPIERALVLERDALVESWRDTDRALVRGLRDRAKELEADLKGAASPPFAAADELGDWFARELTRRSIDTELLPGELDFYALEVERDLKSQLVMLEDDRLRIATSKEFDDLRRIETSLFQARRFAEVEALWSEALESTRAPIGDPNAGWRVSFRELASRRVLRAQRLDSLMDRCSRRLIATDGERLELFIKGIRRKGILRAGPDPRESGFRFVEDRGQKHDFTLSELPVKLFESFMGWGRRSSLSAVDRLDLGMLQFATGEFEAAIKTLRSGRLPEGGALDDLAADILIDAETAKSKAEDRAVERAEEARRRLDRVLSNEMRTWQPRRMLAEVDLLLNQFGDLPFVRERRSDLVALKEELQGSKGRASQARLAAAFPGATVSIPQPQRVRLEFDLRSRDLPRPLSQGQFRFDGLGWAIPKPASSWDSFNKDLGLGLAVGPLVQWSKGKFEVELELTPLGSNAPGQCWFFRVGEMTVAYAEGILPGGSPEAWPRFVGGALELDELEKSIREVKTTRTGEREVLHPERTVIVRIEGSVKARRFELRVGDSDPIQFTNLRLDEDGPPRIEFRSWEPVRVTRLVVEANR